MTELYNLHFFLACHHQCLLPNGKAAVIPTGFITAQQNINLNIRQKLVDEKMLANLVFMSSNIFAITGTNVSLLLIDKSHRYCQKKIQSLR